MKITLVRDFAVGDLTDRREITFEDEKLTTGHTPDSAILATAFNYLFHNQSEKRISLADLGTQPLPQKVQL